METEAIHETKMPKVSVIIPVYGVEKYIERCARSLFEQTLDDLEFLFIDDCTPDGSIEVLKLVLEEYPKRKLQVTIHRMETNSGQALVRRWGMQNANGEFVIHCDSDDWMDKMMLEKMYKSAIDNNSDVVICGYSVVDTKQKRIDYSPVRITNKKLIIADLLKSADWCVWNKLVKRKVYDTDDFIYPSDNMGEDMVITIQCLYRANSISYVNAPLYFYFKNDSSITHQVSSNKILQSFSQCSNNLHLLDSFETRIGRDKILLKSLDALKYVKKNMLLLCEDGSLLDLWRRTEPCGFGAIVFNKYIPIKEKIWSFKKVLRFYFHK